MTMNELEALRYSADSLGLEYSKNLGRKVLFKRIYNHCTSLPLSLIKVVMLVKLEEDHHELYKELDS